MKVSWGVLRCLGCLLLPALVLNGCASSGMSIEEQTKEWIARPLSELKQEMSKPDSYASRSGWKETSYPLSNGNYVFIEPIREGCSINWEINSSGIIIGYNTSGKDCSEESLVDDRISTQKTRADY